MTRAYAAVARLAVEAGKARDLLNPGPVNRLAARHRGDVAAATSPREPEFQQLLDSGAGQLRRRACAPDGDWVAEPLTGSGTLAWEAGDHVVSTDAACWSSNGVYGERIPRWRRRTASRPWSRMRLAVCRSRRDRERAAQPILVSRSWRWCTDPDHGPGLLNPVEAVGRQSRARTDARALCRRDQAGSPATTPQAPGVGRRVCVGAANQARSRASSASASCSQKRSEMQRNGGRSCRARLHMHLPRHFAARREATTTRQFT